jgi:hypothetical protein
MVASDLYVLTSRHRESRTLTVFSRTARDNFISRKLSKAGSPGQKPLWPLFLYARRGRFWPLNSGMKQKGPKDAPWGMYEFAMSDPDETLVRVGWPIHLRKSA